MYFSLTTLSFPKLCFSLRTLCCPMFHFHFKITVPFFAKCCLSLTAHSPYPAVCPFSFTALCLSFLDFISPVLHFTSLYIICMASLYLSSFNFTMQLALFLFHIVLLCCRSLLFYWSFSQFPVHHSPFLHSTSLCIICSALQYFHVLKFIQLNRPTRLVPVSYCVTLLWVTPVLLVFASVSYTSLPPPYILPR